MDIPGVASRIVLFDETAYVLAKGGLHTIDVRVPAEPHAVAFVALAGRLEDVAVTSSPCVCRRRQRSPSCRSCAADDAELVALLPTPGYGEGVLIHQNALFVASGGAGITVFDISNPNRADVALCHRYARLCRRRAVLRGDAIYVADGEMGVTVLDIENLEEGMSPQLAQRSTYVLSLAIHNDLILSVDRYHGLAIARQSVDGKLVQIVQVATPGFVDRVHVAHGMAYAISARDGNVHLLQADGAQQLRQIAYLETPGTATDVDISAEHLIVADGYGGFTVAEPTTLLPVTGDENAFVYGDVRDVAVIGPYIMLAGPRGLQVVEHP